MGSFASVGGTPNYGVYPPAAGGVGSTVGSAIMGTAGGGAAAIPAPPTASSPIPMPTTNTAQADPNLQGLANRFNARLDDPTGNSGALIDQATSKIRDANEGRRKAVAGMLAKRGVLASSSIPEFAESSLQKQEGSDVAKATTDITNARQQSNDQVLESAAGAMAAPGNAARADQSLGLQQWQAAEQAREAQDRANLSSWMSTIDLIGKLGVM